MSPASSADQDREAASGAFGLPLAAGFARHADDSRASGLTPEPHTGDPFEGEAADIEAEFRRRLTGLRGRPRQQRSGILRAAFEWKQTALRALRDKRALAQKSKQVFCQCQRLIPQ